MSYMLYFSVSKNIEVKMYIFTSKHELLKIIFSKVPGLIRSPYGAKPIIVNSAEKEWCTSISFIWNQEMVYWIVFEGSVTKIIVFQRGVIDSFLRNWKFETNFFKKMNSSSGPLSASEKQLYNSTNHWVLLHIRLVLCLYIQCSFVSFVILKLFATPKTFVHLHIRNPTVHFFCSNLQLVTAYCKNGFFLFDLIYIQYSIISRWLFCLVYANYFVKLSKIP